MSIPPTKTKRIKIADRPIVGWREWAGLPELGVDHIKAKIDTGARTSALHAFDVEPFSANGAKWVRFTIHPMQRDDTLVIQCEARLVDRRFVTNSGGVRERRYVIETPLRLGDEIWPIELTLTNRDEMGFRMLIGRSAIQRRVIVDPGTSFRTTKRGKRQRCRETPR